MLNFSQIMNQSSLFSEVSPLDFYRDIFPIGSFEQKGVYVDGQYNGIAVAVGAGENRTKRYTVTDELDVIRSLCASDEFCIMSPISYAGKARTSVNARFLYALAIDLDGVATLENWDFLLEQFEMGLKWHYFIWGLPTPTYLVSSGTGLHLYYVFEKPIPLFKNVVKQLEVLKRQLTWQAWTQGASTLSDNVQYESLFQGFRMVGTITKKATRARAFRFGQKTTIEELNLYVPDEYQVTDYIYKTDLRLDKARELYPEWYQKRIVEHQPRGSWHCKRDLYEWWKRKLRQVEQGHRYWCIMVLATYAVKCGIPKKELEKDAYGLIPFMNTRGDKFTEDDVMHALEAFKDSYITYPIHTIVTRTDIPIEKNKRNGRKRADHLRAEYWINDKGRPIINPCKSNRELALQYMREAGEIKGRPDKSKLVEEWRKANPNGTKAECNRATGIDPKTIRKWWENVCLCEPTPKI
jgi:hypothetical protein